MEYRLVIYKKDGTISKHYYSDYETLDYNATFCQFSTNIVKAIAQKAKLFGWTNLFTIG